MDAFSIFATLTSSAAVFSWLNHRFIRLPNTIGLMVLSLVFSLALVILSKTFSVAVDPFREMLTEIDFNRTLLNGVLGAMLFAGALHIDNDELLDRKDAGQ